MVAIWLSWLSKFPKDVHHSQVIFDVYVKKDKIPKAIGEQSCLMDEWSRILTDERSDWCTTLIPYFPLLGLEGELPVHNSCSSTVFNLKLLKYPFRYSIITGHRNEPLSPYDIKTVIVHPKSKNTEANQLTAITELSTFVKRFRNAIISEHWVIVSMTHKKCPRRQPLTGRTSKKYTV